jgi:hypothetical protein
MTLHSPGSVQAIISDGVKLVLWTQAFPLLWFDRTVIATDLQIYYLRLFVLTNNRVLQYILEYSDGVVFMFFISLQEAVCDILEIYPFSAFRTYSISILFIFFFAHLKSYN